MRETVVITVGEDGKVSKGARSVSRALSRHKGKRVALTVERYKRKRSGPQNRYFHGVVIPCVQERLLDLGFNQATSPEWVKDFVKYNCLITEVASETTGEVIKSLGATSGLNVSEFMEFMERVQQWASEALDIYIPDPNEQGEIFGYDGEQT